MKVPHSKHFTGQRTKKNLSYPLTNVMHTMYQDNLYGDAARGCHHRGDGPDASQRPISHNRQRRGTLSLGSCGEARGVAEEVRAEQVVDRVSPRDPDHQTMEPIGSVSLGEGGKHDGCKEEGCQEAGCQEEGRQEEVTTSSIVS